jgi:hypothetical protein
MTLLGIDVWERVEELHHRHGRLQHFILHCIDRLADHAIYLAVVLVPLAAGLIRMLELQ